MIRTLLVVGLIVFLANLGWIFASPLVKNTMLQGKMEDLAKYRGLKSQGDLIAELRTYIQDEKIPLPNDNLYVQVNDRETLIAGYYETEVNFWFLHHIYEFSPASSARALSQLDLERARYRINAR